MSLKVGSRLMVDICKTMGSVRYIGPARLDKGAIDAWVGLEMDAAQGAWSPGWEKSGLVLVGERGDGMVAGMRFFSCQPGTALFIRRDDLTAKKIGVVVSADARSKAAVKIQSHIRRHFATKRVNALLAARAWNVLDMHVEELGLIRGTAINKAQQQIKHDNEEEDEEEIVERVMKQAEREVADITMELLARMKTSSEYTGPHLRFPLSVDAVKAMMDSLKTGQILHYKYLMSLMLQCKQIFGAEATVQEITIPPGARITVVGDTHGQLDDLFTIFSIQGLPTPENMYLFNGDFVDRGAHGVEVLVTLLALKILYPSAVFLNRGNHEARAQNAWMGFEEEILAKYTLPEVTNEDDRRAALRVHILCEQVFDALPLAAVIHQKIFVCHGGLFRNDNVTIGHLKAISRKREPPLNGKSFEDRVFEDLIWSDPRPTPSYPRHLVGRRVSDRGAGCEFGPAITSAFCNVNGFALVVRSHECVPEGFEVLHQGRLITVFSASRYCGTQTNKGAFITFGADLQPEVQQFYAVTQTASFVSEEERQRALEEDTVHMIIEQIVDKKVDLYWYFTNKDTARTGIVSRMDWATALHSVLGLDLPFLHYQRYLVEEGSEINFSRFLGRFQIRGVESQPIHDSTIERVCQRLLAQRISSIEEAFKRFDRNKDGKIDFAELVACLRGLDVGMADHQCYDLMRVLDTNNDAVIDPQEFESRFAPVFTRMSSAGELDAWSTEQLRNLSSEIHRKRGGLTAAFKRFDPVEKGFFDLDSFTRVMADTYKTQLTKDEAARIFAALDTEHQERVSLRQFIAVMQAADPARLRGIVQHVTDVLFHLRVHVRAAFRSFFDVGKDGRVKAKDFEQGMLAFNSTFGSPLTVVQIQELRAALEDEEGYVAYQVFFDSLSLEIVDESKPRVLLRKSSSFYVQQLERDARWAKMATATVSKQTSIAESDSSDDGDAIVEEFSVDKM